MPEFSPHIVFFLGLPYRFLRQKRFRKRWWCAHSHWFQLCAAQCDENERRSGDRAHNWTAPSAYWTTDWLVSCVGPNERPTLRVDVSARQLSSSKWHRCPTTLVTWARCTVATGVTNGADSTLDTGVLEIPSKCKKLGKLTLACCKQVNL